MSYGLIRTFVLDKKMTIKTILVSSAVAPQLLRNSILRLLSWIQRTSLVTKGHYTLKENLEKGVIFNYETNKKLINYYLNNNSVEPSLSTITGKYSINDIVGNEIYVTKQTNDIYILMVKINHNNHTDIVPILSLYDNGIS